MIAKKINQADPVVAVSSNRLPILYSNNYNISLGGLEKLHPFEADKYRKIYNKLRTELNLHKSQFYYPQEVSQADLLTVHSAEYLETLKDPKQVAQIVEVGAVAYLPSSVVDNALLKSMRYATQGTITAVELALEESWAINLGGGYHHAKAEQGSGFNAYADIPIAVKKYWQNNPEGKVLIVDLDAHQGNGHEAILGEDERVFIYDMYNQQIFPRDEAVKQFIDYDIGIETEITDDEYIKKLQETLLLAIAEVKPDIIIYNAGTDVYEQDKLGLMGLTEAGIIKRDQLVWEQARQQEIPIVMLLSGGYSKQSSEIVSNSIINILQNIIQI